MRFGFLDFRVLSHLPPFGDPFGDPGVASVSQAPPPRPEPRSLGAGHGVGGSERPRVGGQIGGCGVGFQVGGFVAWTDLEKTFPHVVSKGLFQPFSGPCW